MERQVIWSPESLQDLSEILSYLFETYEVKISDNFTRAIEDQIALIQLHPEIGVASFRDPSVRKILITEHNAMFYNLEDDSIVILKIVDTRSRRYNSNK